MIWLRSARLAAVAGVLLASLSCGGGSSTTPSPSFPDVVETFSGTLEVGNIAPFHFFVANPGALNLTLTSLDPVSTLTMGLRVSVWDAATESCPPQQASICPTCDNLSAKVGTSIEVFPQGALEYCVAIYDLGNLQQPADFVLTVKHF